MRSTVIFFTEFSVCYNIMCKENLQLTRVIRTQCTDRVHAIVVLQKKAGLVLGSNLVYSSGWEFSLQLDNQSITTRNIHNLFFTLKFLLFCFLNSKLVLQIHSLPFIFEETSL